MGGVQGERKDEGASRQCLGGGSEMEPNPESVRCRARLAAAGERREVKVLGLGVEGAAALGARSLAQLGERRAYATAPAGLKAAGEGSAPARARRSGAPSIADCLSVETWESARWLKAVARKPSGSTSSAMAAAM